MRTIDYEDWKRRRKAKLRDWLTLENKFVGRVACRRPRDEEKEKLLAELDRKRRARYIKSGKLRIIGKRHWQYRIDFAKTAPAKRDTNQ